MAKHVQLPLFTLPAHQYSVRTTRTEGGYYSCTVGAQEQRGGPWLSVVFADLSYRELVDVVTATLETAMEIPELDLS